MNNRRRALLGIGNGSILPPEYQQVEYIEASGTQYINTNYPPTINTGIEIKFNISNTGSPFGCYGTNNDSRFWLRNRFLIYYMNSAYTSYNFLANTDYVFFMNYNNDGSYKVNDENSVLLPTTPFIGQPMKSLFLFAFNAFNNISDYMQGKIYYVKITENTTIAMDLVPCYRKSDNEPGMYDLVNNVFYTNAGTGTFIVGNDVN